MSDLWLFVLAIAKVALLCGWPIVIAIVYVQVRSGQLARTENRFDTSECELRNKPASEVLARAA